MRKRTPEEQKKNSAYQSRFRKRRQLNLTALKFLENFNGHWPQGFDEKDLRSINMKVRSIIRLPYRWTDNDLARAYKALDTLANDVYFNDYESFTPEHEELSRMVMDDFQHGGGTPVERAKVTLDVMRLVGAELFHAYSEKKPPVKSALPLAMASGMSPCPEWIQDELAKFVVENLSEEERKAFCEKILKSEGV